MKRVHESKNQVCASGRRTDLPWIEFLRLLLMVGALVFFVLALSLLMGETKLVTTSMHALERVRHSALRIPLETFMLNWMVNTEMHSVLSTTRTYPVSSEMCFSKQRSSDSAILCNPLPWQQTYLCDYKGDLQYNAVRDYLAAMGWAHDDENIKYFLNDYQIGADSGLSKHTLKNVCSQQRIFDTVLVHNDVSSVSLVDSVSPTLILATLFLLGALVSAFLAANLHVNRNRSEEYPMFFMPSWVSSYWGVGIGLLIIVLVVVFVWKPFVGDEDDHHHHGGSIHHDHDMARRHGLVQKHHTIHHKHDTNDNDSSDSSNWTIWIVMFLLLAIVSAVVFCSPMRLWYASQMSIAQHYSTANFVKYGISGFVIILVVWVVTDVLSQNTVESVPVTMGGSTNTIWIRTTEKSSSSIVIFVWVLFEAMYLLWPYVHVTPDGECEDTSSAVYASMSEGGQNDTSLMSETDVMVLREESHVASKFPIIHGMPVSSAFNSYSSFNVQGTPGSHRSRQMNAGFAPSFAPVINHEIEHFKTPIHTPSITNQRCELAFVSVYATFALLAWPLVSLLALAFDSKYELDVVVQGVLFGGIFLGTLEYVRCTLLSVLDYSSRYVDCCWNAMTTINCVLQLLVILIEGFVFMTLLDSGLFSSSDAAQGFLTTYFYVTVVFALFEFVWYTIQSYGTGMSGMSLWEGILAVYSVKLLIVLLLAFLPLYVHNKDKLYSPMLDSLKKTCGDAHVDPTTCKVADQLRSEFWLNNTVVQNWPLEPWLCSSDVVSANVKEQYCK